MNSFIWKLFTKDALSGAQTSLHCCLAPFDSLENGQYYADCAPEEERLSEDWEVDALLLWTKSIVDVGKYM